MRRLLVLDVVGLTLEHVQGPAKFLGALAREGFAAPLRTVFPAVTCTVQSTFVTGRMPREHGIVANGWYFRDLAEVWLWRQSNRLVEGDKLWHEAKRRDPEFTCANLFWWYAMAGDFDAVVTPRPAYHADGRKSPDVWTDPPALRADLSRALGEFPLFEFWGPRAGLPSSRWIADASAHVLETRKPTLALVYLPHLDYDFQRFGPDDARSRAAVVAIDAVVESLVNRARAQDYDVLVLSEYAITPVVDAVPINRVLRDAGFLRVHDGQVGELLDPGVSRAFAVADHQCAHVYVKDAADVARVRALLEAVDGIERVLDARGKAELGVDHARAGELVAIAAPDRWFSYAYWQDDAKAPDFARTVDIHKKPGYDPLELLVDPTLTAPMAKVAWTLLKKKLGFRYLLDVVPLDTRLIRGSHGRLPRTDAEGPVLLGTDRACARDAYAATEVRGLVLDRIFRA